MSIDDKKRNDQAQARVEYSQYAHPSQQPAVQQQQQQQQQQPAASKPLSTKEVLLKSQYAQSSQPQQQQQQEQQQQQSAASKPLSTKEILLKSQYAHPGQQPDVQQQPQQPQQPQPAAQTTAAETVQPVTTYTDMAKRVNPELDAAEKAKREKRLRTKKQIAAIGDAISALANMHYTGTSGINAYDPSATLSGKAKENYDKFLADVKSYEDAHKAAMLRAEELDAAATEAKRREAKEDARYKEQKEAADAAQKQTQKNWQTAFDYKKEQDAADRQERITAREQENEFNRERQKALEEYRIAALNSKNTAKAEAAIRGLYGKKTLHGVNGYPIYDRVWNGGWPEVFDLLVANGIGREDDEGDWRYKKRITGMNHVERQKFVDAHYKELPEAENLMKIMADDTPERYMKSLTSENNNTVEDWTPEGDEIIDYEP